jgi:hypothetical protein
MGEMGEKGGNAALLFRCFARWRDDRTLAKRGNRGDTTKRDNAVNP